MQGGVLVCDGFLKKYKTHTKKHVFSVHVKTCVLLLEPCVLVPDPPGVFSILAVRAHDHNIVLAPGRGRGEDLFHLLRAAMGNVVPVDVRHRQVRVQHHDDSAAAHVAQPRHLRDTVAGARLQLQLPHLLQQNTEC